MEIFGSLTKCENTWNNQFCRNASLIYTSLTCFADILFAYGSTESLNA